MVHPLTWATSTGQIPNNLHYHKSGTTLPQNIFLSKLTLSPVWKYPKENTLYSHSLSFFPSFLLELSWLSKGNSKQRNCRRLWGWISSLHRMPIYRHSLKKQTRALAMIYGKKKKKCLQLWKTNPPQIMALSFVSNCGRPTTMGMDPNRRIILVILDIEY